MPTDTVTTLVEQVQALELRASRYDAALVEIAGLRAQLEAVTEEARDWKRSYEASNEHVGKLQADRSRGFTPDWDLLSATQDSLREHMQMVGALRSELDHWKRVAESAERNYRHLQVAEMKRDDLQRVPGHLGPRGAGFKTCK